MVANSLRSFCVDFSNKCSDSSRSSIEEFNFSKKAESLTSQILFRFLHHSINQIQSQSRPFRDFFINTIIRMPSNPGLISLSRTIQLIRTIKVIRIIKLLNQILDNPISLISLEDFFNQDLDLSLILRIYSLLKDLLQPTTNNPVIPIALNSISDRQTYVNHSPVLSLSLLSLSQSSIKPQ